MQNSQKGIRKTIAERLKTARENAGYATLQAFCEQHNFPVKFYQQHENATLSMAASEIIQYCQALKISVSYLMLGYEAEQLRDLAAATKKDSMPNPPRSV